MHDLLRFTPKLFARIWGGRRLPGIVGQAAPPGQPAGEAWLLSDHPEHSSVVTAGPHAGKTINALLGEDETALLGSGARRTRHGRFPLMLKLLDTAVALSVQVHPDDQCAAALGEDDVGKTEMWHVLEADEEALLYTGLTPGTTRESFSAAISEGVIEARLAARKVSPGDAIIVPAGTVHSIGSGILLAEIQQNSNLTYRVYDWGRNGPGGKPRELHLDKAARAIHFAAPPADFAAPLAYQSADGATEIYVLAACRHFAAERVHVSGACQGRTRRHSFHLLLALDAGLTVTGTETEVPLEMGHAVMVPAALERYTVTGAGTFLRYYLPNLREDIITPLRAAGYDGGVIAALGGTRPGNDLRAAL